VVETPTVRDSNTAPSRDARAGATSAAFRAVAGFGLLPATAVGLALAAGGRVVARLSWSAGALWFPEVGTPPLLTGDISQYAFGMTAVWLAPCVDGIQRERIAVGGCVGVLAGAIHAVVYNLEPVTPGDRLWLGVAAGPRVRLRLIGPVVAEAGIDAVVPLIRYRFATRGGTPADATVFQQNVVAVSAWIAAGVGF
jgi:hypothetical protein